MHLTNTWLHSPTKPSNIPDSLKHTKAHYEFTFSTRTLKTHNANHNIMIYYPKNTVQAHIRNIAHSDLAERLQMRITQMVYGSMFYFIYLGRFLIVWFIK